MAAYADIQTDAALGHVFDAADVPAARRGPVNGNRVMARWWSRLQTGMAAARELEETELGFLKETKANAQIAMDAENARLTGSGRTSQFTMTRDGDPGPGEVALMNPIEFTDPLQDIVNVVTVPIRAFSVGAKKRSGNPPWCRWSLQPAPRWYSSQNTQTLIPRASVLE